MRKEKIKVKGSITVTDNTTGKSYVCSKKEFDKASKAMQKKAIALSLAAGISIGVISNTVISNMANNANNAKDTKEAIEMVVSTDNYLNRIKENPLLQKVISQEKIIEIEELSSAITSYKQLKYKQERSFKEEKQYIEACGIISESREMVMNIYTDTIKAKVATAYGISDVKKISDIEIKDYVEDTPYETKHNPQIILPDGTVIVKGHFLNKDKGMDSVLAQHVINARSLNEAGMFSENKKIEDLPLDAIIKTFEQAKEFERNYTISSDEKGNIATTPVEKVTKNSERGEDDR